MTTASSAVFTRMAESLDEEMLAFLRTIFTFAVSGASTVTVPLKEPEST